MRINQFTDLGFRSLMYLSLRPSDTPATISELSAQFSTSRNHLVKVVQFLSHKGLIHAQRGRGGGLELAKNATEYKLGTLMRILEQENSKPINCEALECVLNGSCHLKHILFRAQSAFYNYLDNYTLADLVNGNTKGALQKLYELIPLQSLPAD
ncbi:RrF2 family transcriptional regulator [Chitinophagaceae bacterium MMS25-I14]